MANGAARAVFKDIAKSRKRSGAERLVKILKKKFENVRNILFN